MAYKNEDFFRSISRSSQDFSEICALWLDLIDRYTISNNSYNSLKAIIDKQQSHYQESINQLHKAFITPIDAEDLCKILNCYNLLILKVDIIFRKFLIFNFSKANLDVVNISRYIVDLSKNLVYLTDEISKLKRAKILTEKIKPINNLLNESYQEYYQLLKNAINKPQDSLRLEKTLGIIYSLEEILLGIEEIVKIILEIVIKNI